MTDQTRASLPEEYIWSGEKIKEEDRIVLRELAIEVADIASQPSEEKKRRLWYQHNALRPTRPVIFCDPENGWNEIITPDDLRCAGELAREWEMKLRKEIFWGKNMGDDKVIEPYFDIPHVFSESDWGMKERKIGGKNGGSYRWDPPLKSYQDMNKLHFPQIVVNYETTQQIFSQAQEIMGDILEVRIKGVWWWTLGMTWTLVNLRGLEQIMYDVYDHPRELHQLMAFLRDGTLNKLNFLEENNLLSLNNDGTYVGSGGFGYTNELPQPDFNGKVRTKDMWGFAESQETVGLSPQLFEEFIFPYQYPILDRFGLNCYGCCEPLNKRWEIVKRFPRLRRISVSPWADREDMAKKLEDKYIFSMKPNPAYLAISHLDEDFIRQELRRDLEITRGCIVEVIMKDNNTIGNNPNNVIRWCQIAREEAERIS